MWRIIYLDVSGQLKCNIIFVSRDLTRTVG